MGGEEGGDDVRSAWPLCSGRHSCYNGTDNGFAKPQGGANPTKMCPSSDWSLQLDSMKPESLVTVGQPHHGEYVLESCTLAPCRQMCQQVGILLAELQVRKSEIAVRLREEPR